KFLSIIRHSIHHSAVTSTSTFGLVATIASNSASVVTVLSVALIMAGRPAVVCITGAALNDASGCKLSSLPNAAPTIKHVAQIPAIKLNAWVNIRPLPSQLHAHIATTINHRAHTISITGEIKMRSINNNATANSSKAKPCLTQFIHSPALGMILPWVAPIKISGADKPKPSINKAAKPRSGLPIVDTASSAPNKGAETHGDTTSADKNPAIKLPPVLPSLLSPAWLRPCILLLMNLGRRMLNTPNI